MPHLPELTEKDRRLNVESNILAIISNYGGQIILAGPEMHRMMKELADLFESEDMRRFLPSDEKSP